MTNARIDEHDRRLDTHPVLKAWFAIDTFVALAPPLYWWADGRTAPIIGLPTALCYFLAVGLCITSSIVVADFMTGSEDAEP